MGWASWEGAVQPRAGLCEEMLFDDFPWELGRLARVPGPGRSGCQRNPVEISRLSTFSRLGGRAGWTLDMTDPPVCAGAQKARWMPQLSPASGSEPRVSTEKGLELEGHR